MGRPNTKMELLEQSQKNLDKLFEFIDGLEIGEQNSLFPQGTMNRNIRDVLAHLHHWHLLMLDWYRTGMAGDKPDMPAKGYTWKTTPELNKWIWEKYQSTRLDEARAYLKNSFRQIREIMETHSDEELFEKKRYQWTGTTSLGSYLVSATSSHYEWALKLIKRARRK